jgi:hypothetical protein
VLGWISHYLRRIGDLLHPERESQNALDELKASMGTMEFSAQYQQSPRRASTRPPTRL